MLLFRTTAMKTATYSGIFAVISLIYPAAAGAEEAPKAEPTSESTSAKHPKMHLGMPQPQPHIQRSAYVHNGFYLRAGAGLGLLSTTWHDKVNSTKENHTGFSLGADFLVGGSPAPGLALGGGVLADLGFNSQPGSPGVNMLAGPFFDAFPNNKGGWHLGTLLGFALRTADGTTPVGGGGALFAGHDFWVAPEWSTGFHLRAAGSYTANADVGATNFSTLLLITILNH